MVRARAAASVVFLPGDEGAAALAPLLKDGSDFVRREAAYALGETGSVSAVPLLLNILRSEKNLEMQSAAVISLGKLGDPAAIGPLAELLGRKTTEANEFVRRSAARSIGQIAEFTRTGRNEAVTPQSFLPEEYKSLDGGKAPAGMADLFRNAAARLTAVLTDNNEPGDVRREAAFAIGAIGDKSGVPALKSQLGSPDRYLAEICREALAKLGSDNTGGK
jgi:HEAT repeat protein